ncbi:MAG: hypothetical protein P1T08_00710 [Acidimicrobiia bacterium]|nr:hypothetical protein [Acidimicrobiia bacterium]
MTSRGIFMLLVACAMFATACSENPLSNVGEATNHWIGERTAGEGKTTVSTEPAPTLRPVSEVAWSNDFLAPDPVAPEETIQAVWKRREAGDKFVQAARTEIVGALPGIAFPEFLPDDIEFVSSQLLFDGDGSLSDDFIAAFGMWTAEPYTISRTVGQYGVLWVTYPDPEKSGCERFDNRDFDSCETVAFAGLVAWRLMSGGDETLAWIPGDYQYELFHRSQVDSKMALEMASAMIPLATVTTSTGADSLLPADGQAAPAAAEG